MKTLFRNRISKVTPEFSEIFSRQLFPRESREPSVKRELRSDCSRRIIFNFIFLVSPSFSLSPLLPPLEFTPIKFIPFFSPSSVVVRNSIFPFPYHWNLDQPRRGFFFLNFPPPPPSPPSQSRDFFPGEIFTSWYCFRSFLINTLEIILISIKVSLHYVPRKISDSWLSNNFINYFYSILCGYHAPSN